jgi:hypothetical protein
MDFITVIFEYFTDAPTRFLKKILFLFFIIVGLIIIDKSLNFSFHYDNSKKIEEIQKLNKVLDDKTLSPKERLKLNQLKSEIIFQTRLADFNLIKSLSIDFKSKKDTRNKYWHFLSSSWFWILVMIILPTFFFIQKEHRESKLETLLIVIIIFEPLLLLLAWLTSFLFSQIPYFYNPLWNYLINIFGSFFVLLIFKSIRTEIGKKINESKTLAE